MSIEKAEPGDASRRQGSGDRRADAAAADNQRALPRDTSAFAGDAADKSLSVEHVAD